MALSTSVVGLDVGNDASCVALVRRRGVDVLMNKESKRETPAVVNFGDKMRFLGTDGAAKASLSPQNTVSQIKRLLGKRFSDPLVQADVAKFPFTVKEAPDGGCLIDVMYENERQTFSPEQVLAMVLVDLKKIAEAEAGISVVDCTLSCPAYYTEAERYAMLNAASIAGLNVLRLLNENTATALAYGIFKTDLPETEPVHVMFVDVGHASTQVSVVALKKTGMHVKAHTWDRCLGGRDLDELLFDHFAAEFKVSQKIDIKANKKASHKLRVACEKLKKILSANAESPLNIECIMDDFDVRSKLTRDQLEELAQPFLQKLRAPIEQALAESGIASADLSAVEIVGSSTRVPAVARVVEEITGRAPSRTMNSKECVCRGNALQCAMLSPTFKVREFDVIDACPYAVDFRWEKDGEPMSQRLFEKNSSFPVTKSLTFMRSHPFMVTAHSVSPEGGGKLGEFQVGPFDVPPGAEKAKIKVKVSMNLHGLVVVEGAHLEVEEVVAAPSTAEANGEAAAAADASAGPAPMDTEAAAAKPADASAEGQAAAPVKKKIKKHDVAVKADKVAGLSQKALNDLFEKEANMQLADRLQEETNEKKNALEGYVLDFRNKLYDAYAAYAKEAEKETLLGELQSMEDWLYDEGEDVVKAIYAAKLEELKKKCAPVEERAKEDQARPGAVVELNGSIKQYLAFANNDAPQYAHITPEERATITKECEAAQSWLKEKVALQASLAKHDPPVLVAADVLKKRDTLERVCKPIATKPAPKPAKAEAPKPEPAPMDADTPAAEGQAEPEAQPMEQ